MVNEKVKNTRNFYNNVGAISWGAAGSQHYHIGVFESEDESIERAQERTVELFENRLEPQENDFILDIGCGSGLAAVEIIKRCNCNVVGINISEQQLEVGKKIIEKNSLIDKVKLLKMDAHKLNFKPEVFDGAYAIECIMHMDRNKVFEEVYKALKKDTIFTFCDWYIKDEMLPEELEYLNSITCGSYLTKEAYIELIENSPFKKIEIDDWSNKVLPTYKFWTTVTKEMREQIPEEMLTKIKDSCTKLSDIAIRRLGYFQITCRK